MSRTRAVLTALLMTTLVSGLVVAGLAASAEAKGKHFQTILTSHGLKEQACLDSAGVLYFQGDGRATKKYFGNLTYTLFRDGLPDGEGNFSVIGGRRDPQGGQTAQGELLKIKMKVYTSQHTHLVTRVKAKIEVDTIAAC